MNQGHIYIYIYIYIYGDFYDISFDFSKSDCPSSHTDIPKQIKNHKQSSNSSLNTVYILFSHDTFVKMNEKMTEQKC